MFWLLDSVWQAWGLWVVVMYITLSVWIESVLTSFSHSVLI